MSNEALDTLDRYFFDNSEKLMRFFGNKDTAQEVANFLSYGKYYSGDSPDITILYNDRCLAIEHFEFDCYRNNKGGSENRKEQKRIDREIEAVRPSQQSLYFHGEIKGNSSYEQYISNIESIFTKHYARISDYKKNLIRHELINESTPVKIAFLIDDVSPLGASAYDDSGIQPIILAFSKEFLELMRKSPDVDYVLACSSKGASRFIWLIIKEFLEEYEKNSIDYQKMIFVDYTPQVIGFQAVIPYE